MGLPVLEPVLVDLDQQVVSSRVGQISESRKLTW
jgi:hypothetical protein